MTPHGESQVRTLLQQIDEQRRPTTLERDNIAEHMWRAFHEEDHRRAAQDDLIIIDDVEVDGSRRRSLAKAVLLVAAAVALIAAIPLGARFFVGDSEPIEQLEVAAAPAMRFTATVGGVDLGFSATEPAALGRSGEDFLMVQALNARNPFDSSPDSLTGQVVIARPQLLFEGMAPDAWFAKYDLQAEAVPAQYAGQQIPAWNVVIPDGSAGAGDCDFYAPCLPFAELGSGLDLSLERGFELNRIRLIPVEGSDQPLLVFLVASGPRQGPSDNVAAKLSTEILASLRMGDCPFTC